MYSLSRRIREWANISRRDVEKALGIARGKGNSFIDFDAKPGEFDEAFNPLTDLDTHIVVT